MKFSGRYMEGVISTFHCHPRKLRLKTTRSWDFINLLEGNGDLSHSNGEELLRKASYGKDVIVGVLTMVYGWSLRVSVTKEWNQFQSCGKEFARPVSLHLDRKLIGARYYLKGYEAFYGSLDPRLDFHSQRDVYGHETHVTSTVGWRRVPNASTPSGFSKEGNTCLPNDVMAAIDEAIFDGVQIISVLAGDTSISYAQDDVAIGALHALKQNILVSSSAGNYGPNPSSVANVAPWIITVAASSIDQDFFSHVELGNAW
ncbi:subtilase family protein [Abeliophyllum distichum]|uniref:Subtilase family protein n=1 Tax=Abeliophyllum distichum TaxID=126358 RepID=A0ABD1UH87_9LAMI